MPVDISTLVLLTIAIAYGLGGICILLTFHRSGARGIRLWGRGLLGLGAAYTLLYLYAYVGAAALYAGWLCMLGSMLVMYRALLRIAGNNEDRTAFGIAVIGAAIVAWLYFGVVAPNPVRQMDASHLAVGLIAGRAAWDLWSHALRSRFRGPPLTVAVWLLVVCARPLLEALARDANTGPLEPMHLYGPPAMAFFRVLVMSLLTISVIWMEVSRLYEAVEDQATHDDLTGAANRRAMLALLDRELARAERENRPFSVALFDIDSFKRINDTLGHPAGDQVIKWVAGVIGRSIRPYDTLARYGGEEFLLLMPGAAPAAGAAVAERARLAIQNGDCVADGKHLRITVSAGVAGWSPDTDIDTLLRSADNVLYRAKQTGRNRVVLSEATRKPVARVAG